MAKKHNLHLRIDCEVKQRLIILMQQSGIKSLSRLVRELLRQGKYSLEQHYFQAAEQQCRYKLIAGDKSLARCNMHIYLEEADYRWFKLVHQDLNFFSLAQIVRWLIEVGLRLSDQGDAAFQQAWQKRVKSWENTKQVIRGRMEKVVQLLPFCILNPNDVSWISIYDRGFSPLRKIFIKT